MKFFGKFQIKISSLIVFCNFLVLENSKIIAEEMIIVAIVMGISILKYISLPFNLIIPNGYSNKKMLVLLL